MSATIPLTATTAPAAVMVLTQRRPSAEMQPALSALRRDIPDADVRTLNDVTSAAELITSHNWFPDLVVVCQHRPGEFTSAEAHTLLSLLPLARWICVRGNWCESDGRNGSPWPAAISVRAREAEGRIARELQVLQGTLAALPLTASRDEILEFDLKQLQTTALPADVRAAHRVAIRTSDQQLHRAIADLLTTAGFNVAPSRGDQPRPSVVVWDVDPILQEHWPTVESRRQPHPDQTAIAISSQAYPADVNQLKAIGVAAVIDKTNLAATLVPTIETAIALIQPRSASE